MNELFGQIIIPPSVDWEIKGLSKFGIDLKNYRESKWIKVIKPKNQDMVADFMKSLDKGESEAIALANEINVDFLLIDERIGTKVAKEQGLKTIGLVGILILSKRRNLLKEVKPILDRLRDNVGFWLSEKLYLRILLEVDEID